MHARILVTALWLLAAACSRSPAPQTPSSAQPASSQPAPSQPAETAQAAGPSAVAPTAPGAQNPGQAAGPQGGDSMQGIRAGEPAPGQPRESQPAGPEPAWHAFGNEPFWSVQARGGTLVFTTPDDQRGVTLTGRRVPSLVGTVILGSGPKGEFHFGVTPGECSDGMSDRTHAYASTFIYDGITYKGCAEQVDAR